MHVDAQFLSGMSVSGTEVAAELLKRRSCGSANTRDEPKNRATAQTVSTAAERYHTLSGAADDSLQAAGIAGKGRAELPAPKKKERSPSRTRMQ
jgi:hypothetical protein